MRVAKICVCGILFVMTISFVNVRARPPSRQHQEKPELDETKKTDEEAQFVDNVLSQLPYEVYLKKVIHILEKDTDLKEELERSDDISIVSSKLIDDLIKSHSKPQVLFELNDAKRKELNRLKHLGANSDHIGTKDHIFVGKDLSILLQTAMRDMNIIEQQMEDRFKRYEMEKEFKRRETLKNIKDDKARKEEEKRMKDRDLRHKDHEKLKYPMTRDQLMSLWVKGDHQKEDEFDLKSLFSLHDMDGDGFLNEEEINGMVIYEVEKAYNLSDPDDDPLEQSMELHRMMRQALNDADLNKDFMISLEEFLHWTGQKKFDQHQDWKTLDEMDIFSSDEFDNYVKMMELNNWQGHPYYPEHPGDVGNLGLHPMGIESNEHEGLGYHDVNFPQMPHGPPQPAAGIQHQQMSHQVAGGPSRGNSVPVQGVPVAVHLETPPKTLDNTQEQKKQEDAIPQNAEPSQQGKVQDKMPLQKSTPLQKDAGILKQGP